MVWWPLLDSCPSPTEAAEGVVAMPTLSCVHLCAVICPLGLFISDLMERYFLGSLLCPSIISLLRLARVCRLLYTIRCTRGIRRLLLGVVTSLPALFNIVTVVILLKISFALFAMFHFANVEDQSLDFINFKDFINSMIAMFMVCASGGWDFLLYPMMRRPPDCDPFKDNAGLPVSGDCGQPGLAIAFFATYLALSSLFAICLYLTVILGTYNSEDMEIISEKHLQMFYDTWMKYDPDASLYIPYRWVQISLWGTVP